MTAPTPLPSDQRDMTMLEKLRVRIETYGGFQLTKPESLALIECAEALKWMHPRNGVWRTPTDHQASFAEAALRKLETL